MLRPGPLPCWTAGPRTLRPGPLPCWTAGPCTLRPGGPLSTTPPGSRHLWDLASSGAREGQGAFFGQRDPQGGSAFRGLGCPCQPELDSALPTGAGRSSGKTSSHTADSPVVNCRSRVGLWAGEPEGYL
ncbi:hypothetical protein E5288_WYG022282 [Bos mutus]|uniref:Uncharacterized protein n=1 Tax=Bos mutus TaxID=72004 RepID=A0A6B0RWR9_9CETA|nr:hypothetical protein [Bos mutus]